MSVRSKFLIQELITGEHPSEETLARYVDDVLGRRERLEIEAHAEGCNTCLETLHDFRDMRRHIEPDSHVRWYAVAAAVVIAIIGTIALLVQRPAAPARVVHVVARPAARAVLDPVVTQTLNEGRIAPPPSLAELLQVDVARGTTTDAAAEPVAPDRVVVSSVRPRFQWHRRSGERSVVRVFHRNEEVGHSTELTGDEWKPAFDLQRGDTYSWQVELTSDGKTRVVPAPPQPPAMFIVLDQAQWNQIEQARATTPTDHLRIGVLAARAGLREDAEKELIEASRQPAADARIGALIESLQRWGK